MRLCSAHPALCVEVQLQQAQLQPHQAQQLQMQLQQQFLQLQQQLQMQVRCSNCIHASLLRSVVVFLHASANVFMHYLHVAAVIVIVTVFKPTLYRRRCKWCHGHMIPLFPESALRIRARTRSDAAANADGADADDAAPAWAPAGRGAPARGDGGQREAGL